MKRIIMPYLTLLLLLHAAPARADKLHCPSITENDEKNNDTARKYFTMGGVYMEREDFSRAAESFECVLKFVPYSLTTRYNLARAYDGMEVYSRAREHYEMILVYDSDEAESLKPGIRKRLAEIRDLKDRIRVVTIPVEPAVQDEKTCPQVVLQGLQETLTRAEKRMDETNWIQARDEFDKSLKNLDGSTAEQRKLCLSGDMGVHLLMLAGITHFHLQNLGNAQEFFTRVFRNRPEAKLPEKFGTADLQAFFQKSLRAYFQSLQGGETPPDPPKVDPRTVEPPGKTPEPPGKTPEPPGKAPGRSWRIILASSIGYDFGLIGQNTITEMGAYTENLGWGRNTPIHVMETGVLLYGRHRFTAGMRYSKFSSGDSGPFGSLQVETSTDLQFFARYVRLHFPDSVVQPYWGGGGFGGPLRVRVKHGDGNETNDTVELGGAFLNGVAGLQLCLGRDCHIAFQIETNLLWKFASPGDPPLLNSEWFKTVIFWFNAGLSLSF